MKKGLGELFNLKELFKVMWLQATQREISELDKVIITVQDMNLILIFPGFILAFIIVLYYKRKMKNMYAKIDAAYKNKNRVHFYVARDENKSLYLYLGKPNRSLFSFYSSRFGMTITSSDNFSKYGLNGDDYAYLKWEDKPVEVFINMED